MNVRSTDEGLLAALLGLEVQDLVLSGVLRGLGSMFFELF
jgi:hypothetical protein